MLLLGCFKKDYKGKTGNEKDLTEAKLIQNNFFADIKGIAGNPNSKKNGKT